MRPASTSQIPTPRRPCHFYISCNHLYLGKHASYLHVHRSDPLIVQAPPGYHQNEEPPSHLAKHLALATVAPVTTPPLGKPLLMFTTAARKQPEDVVQIHKLRGLPPPTQSSATSVQLASQVVLPSLARKSLVEQLKNLGNVKLNVFEIQVFLLLLLHFKKVVQFEADDERSWTWTGYVEEDVRTSIFRHITLLDDSLLLEFLMGEFVRPKHFCGLTALGGAFRLTPNIVEIALIRLQLPDQVAIVITNGTEDFVQLLSLREYFLFQGAKMHQLLLNFVSEQGIVIFFLDNAEFLQLIQKFHGTNAFPNHDGVILGCGRSLSYAVHDRMIITKVALASIKYTSSVVISKAAVRSSMGVSHLLYRGKLIILFSFLGSCAGALPSSDSNWLKWDVSSFESSALCFSIRASRLVRQILQHLRHDLGVTIAGLIKRKKKKPPISVQMVCSCASGYFRRVKLRICLQIHRMP
ncbi:ras GTPase activator [Hortaea werneckii]|nr:ras GTPase activator [Hortaea werneckii]